MRGSACGLVFCVGRTSGACRPRWPGRRRIRPFVSRISGLLTIDRVQAVARSTGYLTNCQDVGKIKILALVSTGLKTGLVTVNLESWHLTCSAPPTANGEALRQKADARSVSTGIPLLLHSRTLSRRGTPARSRPSTQVRALPDSLHFQLLTAEQAAGLGSRSLSSRSLAAVPGAGRVAGVVLRLIGLVFRQMMVGSRTERPLRPPVFLFS